MHSTRRCFARNFCLLRRRPARSKVPGRPPPFRSSQPSISHPFLVGAPARAPKGPGLRSTLLSFSSPVHPSSDNWATAADALSQVPRSSPATLHQVYAPPSPPFLLFGYLYSDLSRFYMCIMPTKLRILCKNYCLCTPMSCTAPPLPLLPSTPPPGNAPGLIEWALFSPGLAHGSRPRLLIPCCRSSEGRDPHSFPHLLHFFNPIASFQS